MGVFLIIGIGFYIFGYIGYKIATTIFDLIFPSQKDSTYTFIDNSVHNHHHEHKNIHIIDEKTHDDILNNLN